MLCLKTIINCFALEHSVCKTRHLKCPKRWHNTHFFQIILLLVHLVALRFLENYLKTHCQFTAFLFTSVFLSFFIGKFQHCNLFFVKSQLFISRLSSFEKFYLFNLDFFLNFHTKKFDCFLRRQSAWKCI